jgi:hypothetical protein
MRIKWCPYHVVMGTVGFVYSQVLQEKRYDALVVKPQCSSLGYFVYGFDPFTASMALWVRRSVV